MGAALFIARPARHAGRPGARPACRAGGLWARVFAACAALVVWATAGSDVHQSAADPHGAHRLTARHTSSGGAGHHTPGAVGSLAGRHRGRGPHTPHWLGSHPVSLGPKGRFRSTTLALIQRLQRAFPAGVRWTLVADR